MRIFVHGAVCFVVLSVFWPMCSMEKKRNKLDFAKDAVALLVTRDMSQWASANKTSSRVCKKIELNTCSGRVKVTYVNGPAWEEARYTILEDFDKEDSPLYYEYRKALFIRSSFHQLWNWSEHNCMLYKDRFEEKNKNTPFVFGRFYQHPFMRLFNYIVVWSLYEKNEKERERAKRERELLKETFEQAKKKKEGLQKIHEDLVESARAKNERLENNMWWYKRGSNFPIFCMIGLGFWNYFVRKLSTKYMVAIEVGLAAGATLGYYLAHLELGKIVKTVPIPPGQAEAEKTYQQLEERFGTSSVPDNPFEKIKDNYWNVYWDAEGASKHAKDVAQQYLNRQGRGTAAGFYGEGMPCITPVGNGSVSAATFTEWLFESEYRDPLQWLRFGLDEKNVKIQDDTIEITFN